MVIPNNNKNYFKQTKKKINKRRYSIQIHERIQVFIN